MHPFNLFCPWDISFTCIHGNLQVVFFFCTKFTFYKEGYSLTLPFSTRWKERNVLWRSTRSKQHADTKWLCYCGRCRSHKHAKEAHGAPDVMFQCNAFCNWVNPPMGVASLHAKSLKIRVTLILMPSSLGPTRRWCAEDFFFLNKCICKTPSRCSPLVFFSSFCTKPVVLFLFCFYSKVVEQWKLTRKESAMSSTV